MYSQKRFALFTVIFLHLQQPSVASLPQEGGGVRVFDALTAHIQFNVWGADGATELCGEQVCLQSEVFDHRRGTGNTYSTRMYD